MAWTSLNTLGSNQSKTAGTSIALTTSAAVEAGHVVVVIVAIDNTQTTDGNTSEVSSITDSAGGNTWVKAREFCNGQGGAASGATVSVWYSKLTNAIVSGGTITANLANSITAKAISAWEFSIAAGATVSVAGTPQDLANDNADPGSMTVPGLSSREYLFIRGIAAETNSTAALMPTSNFAAFTGNQTSGAGAASNMAVRGEFAILTGTTATSDPTYTAVDCASVFFALRESATQALDGNAVSTSSGVGGLGRIHETSGTATSSSSGIGGANLRRPLAGNAVGVSSGTAVATKVSGLGGAAAAASSGTAALALTIRAVGAALGASSAAGTVALLKPLAGNSIASSSAIGDLFAKKVLAGSTLGQSSAVGTAIRTSGVAGAAFSTSSVVGNLLAQYTLAGAAVAISSAVGSLTKTGAVSGVAAGVSLGTAAMALSRALIGEAIGISSCTGEFISGVIQLQGVAISTSSALGGLRKNAALAGASVAASSGIGSLSQTFALTAQTVGESSGIAALALIFPLAGSTAGASSGTAALAVLWQVTGTTAGESSAIGNLSVVGPGVVVHDLMGTAVSLSMAMGTLSLTRLLNGTASGHSRLLFYWAGIPRSRSVGVR